MHFIYSYPYLSSKQLHIMYYSSKKKKKKAFPFSFQTGTGSQWEGPHNNNNKATCIQSKFTIPLDSINLWQKYYKTSPTYTLLSFSH